MRLITVVLVLVFASTLHQPVDAGYRSSSRSSSSRYSSSRYSYSSSRYRSRWSSYRSMGTYRRYSRYSRYSYGRTSSRISSSYKYRTSLSAVGMGGITVNKQTLLLAGSVYVASSMRPRLYMTSGRVFSKAVDEYAICSGQVRWNPVYKTGVYVETDIGSNSSNSSADLSQWRNGTTDFASNSSSSSSSDSDDVTYRYFLCPNDLMDGILDDEDAFCCGPPGNQMCCDEEDFWEQDPSVGFIKSVVIIAGAAAFILVAGGCHLYFFRKRIASCSCHRLFKRRCRSTEQQRRRRAPPLVRRRNRQRPPAPSPASLSNPSLVLQPIDTSEKQQQQMESPAPPLDFTIVPPTDVTASANDSQDLQLLPPPPSYAALYS